MLSGVTNVTLIRKETPHTALITHVSEALPVLPLTAEGSKPTSAVPVFSDSTRITPVALEESRLKESIDIWVETILSINEAIVEKKELPTPISGAIMASLGPVRVEEVLADYQKKIGLEYSSLSNLRRKEEVEIEYVREIDDLTRKIHSDWIELCELSVKYNSVVKDVKGSEKIKTMRMTIRDDALSRKRKK